MDKSNKPKLSSRQYVKIGANVCPSCKSDNINGGPLEVDGVIAWSTVNCAECDATWEDIYRIEGYEHLRQTPQKSFDIRPKLS